MPSKLVIENKGSGNCLYYAYAISLMYKLRGSYSQEVQYDFLKEIGLEDEAAMLIVSILSHTNPDGLFDANQLELIQDILGQKLREYTAKIVTSNLKANMENDDFYQSIVYGFRKALVKQAHQNQEIRKNSHFIKHDNFEKCEIFKVAGFSQEIEAQMQHDYFNFLEIYFEATESSGDEDRDQIASQIIDGFVHEQATQFLIENDYTRVERLGQHISKNGRDAVEEEAKQLTEGLNVVLSKVLKKHQQPVIDANVIELGFEERHLDQPKPKSSPSTSLASFFKSALSKARKLYFDTIARIPDIILRNHNDGHWVSTVPPRIYLENLLKSDPQNENLVKILNLLDNIQYVLNDRILLTETYRDPEFIAANKTTAQEMHRITREIAKLYDNNLAEPSILNDYETELTLLHEDTSAIYHVPSLEV